MTRRNQRYLRPAPNRRPCGRPAGRRPGGRRLSPAAASRRRQQHSYGRLVPATRRRHLTVARRPCAGSIPSRFPKHPTAGTRAGRRTWGRPRFPDASRRLKAGGVGQGNCASGGTCILNAGRAPRGNATPCAVHGYRSGCGGVRGNCMLTAAPTGGGGARPAVGKRQLPHFMHRDGCAASGPGESPRARGGRDGPAAMRALRHPARRPRRGNDPGPVPGPGAAGAVAEPPPSGGAFGARGLARSGPDGADAGAGYAARPWIGAPRVTDPSNAWQLSAAAATLTVNALLTG